MHTHAFGRIIIIIIIRWSPAAAAAVDLDNSSKGNFLINQCRELFRLQYIAYNNETVTEIAKVNYFANCSTIVCTTLGVYTETRDYAIRGLINGSIIIEHIVTSLYIWSQPRRIHYVRSSVSDDEFLSRILQPLQPCTNRADIGLLVQRN